MLQDNPVPESLRENLFFRLGFLRRSYVPSGSSFCWALASLVTGNMLHGDVICRRVLAQSRPVSSLFFFRRLPKAPD